MENLLRTNLTFQLLLGQLVNGITLTTSDKLVSSLDITAKYELIKLKSLGHLRISEGNITMTSAGYKAYGKLPTLCQMIQKVG